jgi:2-polyprenyl-3-methyl-5-hydroxy-6-metoxy-1,4-benzoquinol methylase
LSLIHVRIPNLELRKADIVAGPVERGTFDLVTARAVLHHVADAQAAIANMAGGLKPGGALLLIEPDFLPVSVAEPREVRAFWDGWLTWSRER